MHEESERPPRPAVTPAWAALPLRRCAGALVFAGTGASVILFALWPSAAEPTLPAPATQVRAIAIDGEGVPHVSASASSLVDGSLRTRIHSGLHQTLVTHVDAYLGDEEDEPLASGRRTCHVTYDLLSLTYRVLVQTETLDDTWTLTSIDEVIHTCVDIDDLRVGTPSDWVGVSMADARFAARVDLNPVSPELMRGIRRWLARPGGADEDNQFFGSFVSLFVNRTTWGAERSLHEVGVDEPPP